MIVRGHLENDGNLTCTSPEQAAAGDVSVEVTLNGQQYSRSAVRFAYYEAESVTRLSPSSGLIGGSTVVRVLGSGFRPFEEGLCRFGDLSVNATWVSGSEVRCVSAAAATATYASDEVWLRFHDHEDIMSTSEVHTTGPRRPTVKDGALQLTSAETMQERSLVVRAPRMSGQQYFAAEFDLFVGNGLGGEGVSACLGDLPDAPFGEEGAGEGLRVRLLTYADRLEICMAASSFSAGRWRMRRGAPATLCRCVLLMTTLGYL